MCGEQLLNPSGAVFSPGSSPRVRGAAAIIDSAMSWFVAALLGAVLVALKRLYSLILANQEGTKTLLRSRLYDIHERTVEKGYCPDERKRETEQVYTAYHALGGNGVGTQYYQEILNAPVCAERG